ncbi:hypothetical protein [Deinococcus sp. 6GRE01]|uniref:hypothetical protein n=1 Tax=Deinococcus sp. 6GRE01 TaxID=2745873 RepID=UPI001E413EFE|nr:hypothetical protein [Deinococcus sp. 6GRE01]MCD0155895.1 hypothetical protein [Deinococcus sp. 6GRE01]
MTNGNKIPNLNAVRGEITEALAPVQAAADNASSALSNLTLAELATRPISAGPQLADGSRWIGAAASPLPGGILNGGTVVAAADGVWVREFTGPVYAPWFGCKGDGVTVDDEPMGRAARAAIYYRSPLDLDGLTYVLLQVELTAGLTVQGGRILSDVTGGGTSVRAPFYFNGQDTSPGKNRATMEARRIYDIVFRNVEFDGRRNLHTNIVGFGDGARCLVSVWGRASRILFDRCRLHDAATDAVMLLTNDGVSVTSTVPGERVDFDPCFIDVEFRDCKIYNNRRCGISVDGFQNVRLTGSTEIYDNGNPLPGQPSWHGDLETAHTSAQWHAGIQGATVPSAGRRYYYGWGIDCEGYNIGSCSRGLYVADTVKIYGNAGQAVQVMVNDTEGQDARFQPWGDVRIYGEVGKGVYNSESEAVTFVSFRGAADRLTNPSFVDVDVSPRVLTGLIGIRDCQLWRVAPRQAFALADTGSYQGRIFGSSKNSTGGTILYPANEPDAQWAANDPGNVNTRAAADGVIPAPLVLPTITSAGADPATITLTPTILSRDGGRVRIRYAGTVQATSGGGWSVLAVSGLATLTGKGHRVESVQGSVQDNNSGAYRLLTHSPATPNQFSIQWGGSLGVHVVSLVVTLRLEYMI